MKENSWFLPLFLAKYSVTTSEEVTSKSETYNECKQFND
jgi:hypothetical protein